MPAADKENLFENLELLKLAVISFMIIVIRFKDDTERRN